MSQFGNITITGGTNQNTFGENHGEQTQTVGGGGIEFPVPSIVFDTIEKSLPSEHREELKRDVMEPLRAIAALPVEKQQEPGMVEKVSTLMAKLHPFAPQIAKSIATFGAAFLKASPFTGPWVAGLQAVCELSIKQQDDKLPKKL